MEAQREAHGSIVEEASKPESPLPEVPPGMSAEEATKLQNKLDKVTSSMGKPPSIQKFSRKGLPPALAKMVDYTEFCPWPEVEEEVFRQWPQLAMGGQPLEQIEARSKLAGLVLGVALGVTAIPHPEGITFAALKQARDLNKMVGKIHIRKQRETKEAKRALKEHRRSRKAKRRAR